MLTIKCSHRLVSSVVKALLSVQEVWGSNSRPIKATQCCPQLTTTMTFLRSCVAQVLSRRDGPHYLLHNTASIMKIWLWFFFNKINAVDTADCSDTARMLQILMMDLMHNSSQSNRHIFGRLLTQEVQTHLAISIIAQFQFLLNLLKKLSYYT